MNTDFKNLLEDKRRNIIFYNDQYCDKAIALLGDQNELIYLVKILEKSEEILKLVLGFNHYNFFMIKSILFMVKDYKSLNLILSWILLCIENYHLNITCDVIDRIKLGKNSGIYERKNLNNFNKNFENERNVKKSNYDFEENFDYKHFQKITEEIKNNDLNKITNKFSNMSKLQSNQNKPQLDCIIQEKIVVNTTPNDCIVDINVDIIKNSVKTFEENINANLSEQKKKKTKLQLIEEIRNKQKFIFHRSKLNSKYSKENEEIQFTKKSKSCEKIIKISTNKESVVKPVFPNINIKYTNKEFTNIFQKLKQSLKNPYKYLNPNSNANFFSIKESENIENEDDYSGLVKHASNNNSLKLFPHQNSEILSNCFIDEIMMIDNDPKIPICIKLDQHVFEEYKFLKRPSFSNINLKYKRNDRSMTNYTLNDNNDQNGKYSFFPKSDEKHNNNYKKYTNNSTNFSTPEANRNQNISYNYQKYVKYNNYGNSNNNGIKISRINKKLFQYEKNISTIDNRQNDSLNENEQYNETEIPDFDNKNKNHSNDNFYYNSNSYQNNYRQRSNTTYGNNYSHSTFTNNVWKSKNKFFN